MRLTIGSRTSDLARIQAYDVAHSIKKIFPEITDIQFHFKKSLGDINLTDPLWKMPEKGVFTEDLKQDLLKGVCDLVVHSWKDLPVETGPQTEIIATLPRADVRDVLLFKKDSLKKLKSLSDVTAKIFSSSPRRAFNLNPFLKIALPFSTKAIEFLPVRGNILTRCQKLIDSTEVHGLVVAKAALDRLLSTDLNEFSENKKNLKNILSQCHWMVLPISANPPAAAQGALAIEIQKSRDDLQKLFKNPAFNCNDTFQNVQHERNWLAEQGGGCHQKLGVVFLTRNYGVIQSLKGETPQGTKIDTLQVFTNSFPKASSKNQIWPRSSFEFFSRKVIPNVQIPKNDLWIAKSSALPDEAISLIDSNTQIVWTAGLETWGQLAKKGIWVNGSAEGFGEDESTRIEALAQRPLTWVKLSHSEGFQGPFPLIATYELIENSQDYNELEKYDFFYWKSGSEFLQALKNAPKIKTKIHGCGPGNTAEILKRAGVKPHICLNQKQWLEEVLP